MILTPIGNMPKGKTLFFFLEWLHQRKRYPTEFYAKESRMANPFTIPDDEFDKLWEEFTNMMDSK